MVNDIAKNEIYDLTTDRPQLKNVMVGAGWRPDMYEGGQEIDVDLSCFLLNPMDLTREDEDFIFYNNTESEANGVRHKGDNRTGAGEGDDEIIFIDLSKVDYEISTIVFVASIYEGAQRDQDFSQVKDAYIRIYDEDNKEELMRFDLAEDFAGEQAVKIGALERMGNSWSFKAIGEPIKGGLGKIAEQYGLMIVPS